MENLTNLKKNTTYETTSHGVITYLGTKSVTDESGKKRTVARIKKGDVEETMSIYQLKSSVVKTVESSDEKPTQAVQVDTEIPAPVVSNDDVNTPPAPPVQPVNQNPTPPANPKPVKKSDGFFKEMVDGLLWWLGMR